MPLYIHTIVWIGSTDSWKLSKARGPREHLLIDWHPSKFMKQIISFILLISFVDLNQKVTAFIVLLSVFRAVKASICRLKSSSLAIA